MSLRPLAFALSIRRERFRTVREALWAVAQKSKRLYLTAMAAGQQQRPKKQQIATFFARRCLGASWSPAEHPSVSKVGVKATYCWRTKWVWHCSHLSACQHSWIHWSQKDPKGELMRVELGRVAWIGHLRHAWQWWSCAQAIGDCGLCELRECRERTPGVHNKSNR